MTRKLSRRQLITIFVLVAAAAVAVVQLTTDGWLRDVATVIVGVIIILAAVAEILGIEDFLRRDASTKPPSKDAAEIAKLQSCGDSPLSLETQRLSVSEAFGNYFVSLLEREQSYVHLPEQIDLRTVDATQNASPLAFIYDQLLDATGAQLLVISAQGGMGKSTLAARIVRCLHDKGAIRLVLGDSAKSEEFDVVDNSVTAIPVGYSDPSSFLARVRTQLGMPAAAPSMTLPKNAHEIRDRLVGEHGIIIVDNLDTVNEQEDLVHLLRILASRDVRVLITSRRSIGFASGGTKSLLIHLRGLVQTEDISSFLQWHIQQYQRQHSRLVDLRMYLENNSRLRQLGQRTGGNPLLIQFAASEIARRSWDYLDQLPENLYGPDLLKYLYDSSWDELSHLDVHGQLAQDILLWIARQQDNGKRVTSKVLSTWVEEQGKGPIYPRALDLLYERFLLINSDQERGNYSIVPSLSAFLEAKQSQ